MRIRIGRIPRIICFTTGRRIVIRPIAPAAPTPTASGRESKDQGKETYDHEEPVRSFLIFHNF